MTTEILSFFKAQQIGDRQVRTREFEFADPLPRFSDPRETAHVFDAQATLLEAKLHATLPGGTYDALLCKMMIRSASRLTVSWPDATAPATESAP